MAADNPGKQPIVMPNAVETSIAMRFRGVRACRNPAAIKPNVSNMRDPRYEKRTPAGSGTLRKSVKTAYTNATNATNVIRIHFEGTLKKNNVPTR